MIPRYLPVLSDRFSAESVFDALATTMVKPDAGRDGPMFAGTEMTSPWEQASSGSDPASRALGSGAGAAGAGAAGAGAAATSSGPASSGTSEDGSQSGKAHGSGRGDARPSLPSRLQLARSNSLPTSQPGLGFPVFLKYVRALSRSMVNEHTPWESMRAQLELDPDEILVRTEEFVSVEVAANMYVTGLGLVSRLPSLLPPWF